MASSGMEKAPQFVDVLLHCGGDLTASLRHALMSSGYNRLTVVGTYEEALAAANRDDFDVIFFAASEPMGSGLLTVEFLGQIQELCPKALLIAVLLTSSVADVFKVLRHGARACLVPPFVPSAVEDVLTRAKTEFRLSVVVTDELERNRSLARMILDALDSLALGLRKTAWDSSEALALGSPEFVQLQHLSQQFTDTVKSAKAFCQDSQEALLESIVEEGLHRALKQLRLRRTRVYLDRKRAEKEPGVEPKKRLE